jgi:cell division protein FtsI (penicillin-binding protein 3)
MAPASRDRRSTQGRRPGAPGDRTPARPHREVSRDGRRTRGEVILPAGRGRPGAPRRPPGQDPPGRGAGRSRRPGADSHQSRGPREEHDRVPRPGDRDRRARARRRSTLNRGDPARRLRASLLCIAFALSLFAGRLVQLQGMEGSTYRTLADLQRVQSVQLPAVRGGITTADGATLAATLETDMVFADPKLMTSAQEPQIAAALAGPLGMPRATILGLIQRPSSPQYVVLKRAVQAEAGNRIAALTLPGSQLGHLPGIGLQPSYSTSYPNGQLAAPLIGFTNTDSAGNLIGEAGIESQYNALLAGHAGTEEVQTTNLGQPIPLGQDTLKPTVPGRGIKLTIISSIQYAAEQACKQRVLLTRAAYCTAVVMQPHTGQILAMAQYPTFDPAHPASLAATTNDAVADVWQPGSTGKAITVAAALERGRQTAMSPYTVPNQIVVDGYPFHDAETHPTLHLTIAGVLANSSNVGMVQVVKHVPPAVQYAYLRAFGLGKPTGLNLPGASDGILPAPSQWSGDTRYTLAFGQGVAVNAVQMAGVYATIANGGVRVPPSIVAGTTSAAGQFMPAATPRGHRVIKASTARTLIRILQQVPMINAQGGMPWGEIAGYPIAAKTGTAQEWDPARHCLCNYGSSYIGMAPANNPKVVVAINLQDPKTGYFGIEVAGPVFYQVMRSALQTLKIPPNYVDRPYVRLTAP